MTNDCFLDDRNFRWEGITVSILKLCSMSRQKRIYEYKRQHLKVLHIITLCNGIKEYPANDITLRPFIFSSRVPLAIPWPNWSIQLRQLLTRTMCAIGWRSCLFPITRSRSHSGSSQYILADGERCHPSAVLQSWTLVEKEWNRLNGGANPSNSVLLEVDLPLLHSELWSSQIMARRLSSLHLGLITHCGQICLGNRGV